MLSPAAIQCEICSVVASFVLGISFVSALALNEFRNQSSLLMAKMGDDEAVCLGPAKSAEPQHAIDLEP